MKLYKNIKMSILGHRYNNINEDTKDFIQKQ